MLALLLAILVSTGAIAEPPPADTLHLWTLGVATALYVPFIIMMLSLAGMYARYREQWGGLGQIGLTLVLVGLVVVPLAGAAGALGTAPGSEPSAAGRVGSLVAILGTTALGAGFAAFGLAALRSGIPSRWFGGVLIGIGLFQPLILLVSVLRVLAYSLGWIVLGWALPPTGQTPHGDGVPPE